MTITRSLLVALLVLVSVPHVRAQDKQASGSQEVQPAAPEVPLKVQFLVTEYDGTKKIASMPYTATVTTSPLGKRDPQGGRPLGVLRVGARIALPIGPSQKADDQKPDYIDVGTNIDYWVWPWTDNRYLVSGTIALSSLYGQDSGDEPKAGGAGDATVNGFPPLHETRADFSIVLRDGQPEEALSVTDPITGRVFKLEVTVDAMK